MNLLAYAEKTLHQPVSDLPLGPVDFCLLNELAYLPFDALAAYHGGFEQGISLAQLNQEFKNDRSLRANWFLATPQRLKLLELMALSNRFSSIRLSKYRALQDQEKQVQFAALTLVIPGVLRQVIFRGTDDSLVGWQEDFHLASQDDIPAQSLALRYLTQTLQVPSLLPTVVTGHSKGGHLAIYAASRLEDPGLQDELDQVLAFDSPGFASAFTQDPGYRRILPKIHEYLPVDSQVGRLMFKSHPRTFVASSSFGIMQHSIFYWRADEQAHDFQQVEAASKNSDRLERVIHSWLDRHSSDEIRLVVDTCFGLAMGQGYSSLLDVGQNFISFVQTMREAAKTLDPQTAQTVQEALGDFVVLWRQEGREAQEGAEPARLPLPSASQLAGALALPSASQLAGSLPKLPMLRPAKPLAEDSSQAPE